MLKNAENVSKTIKLKLFLLHSQKEKIALLQWVLNKEVGLGFTNHEVQKVKQGS